MPKELSEWQSEEYVSAFLERADQVPHRSFGETVLLDEIPLSARRF